MRLQFGSNLRTKSTTGPRYDKLVVMTGIFSRLFRRMGRFYCLSEQASNTAKYAHNINGGNRGETVREVGTL